jgi:hypothetical protein
VLLIVVAVIAGRPPLPLIIWQSSRGGAARANAAHTPSPGLCGPLSRSQVRAPRPGTIPEVRQHLHGVTAEDGAAILAQQ